MMTWEGEEDVEEDVQVYSLSSYVKVKSFVYQKLKVKKEETVLVEES